MDDEEWYVICDEKEILLEKNDNDEYKLSFDIKENKTNDASVLEIFKEEQFFELLYELNKDLIKTLDVTCDNKINKVALNIINLKNEYKNNKNINIYINFLYNFQDKQCFINSVPFENNVNQSEDNIYISDFKLSCIEGEPTKILLKFNVNDIIDNNVFQMYIGLYFKKIFHRFKMYFE